MAEARAPVPELVRAAGYGPQHPVLVGYQWGDGRPRFQTQGHAPGGAELQSDTVVYVASLAKQVTAACAALLMADGALDMDDSLRTWLPELPAWAEPIRLRHLLHHIGGLPSDAEVEATLPGRGDRTASSLLTALTRTPEPSGPPGRHWVYSNAGYVCLASAISRAGRRGLADLAQDRIFAPLEMRHTCFFDGPGTHPSDAVPIRPAHPAPLSLGDGGLWSTAADLLRWSRSMDIDTLGLSEVLRRPGELKDGTELDYACGVGVRSRGGWRMYRHGGGWSGVRSLLVQVPQAGLDCVVIALDDDSERRVALMDAVLDLVLGT